MRVLTACIAVLTVAGASATRRDPIRGTVPGAALERRIALTFDDLPLVSRTRRDFAFQERVTADLLATLGRRRVPAIGFVNENKLEVDGVTAGSRLSRTPRPPA